MFQPEALTPFLWVEQFGTERRFGRNVNSLRPESNPGHRRSLAVHRSR
jgi:hypothetical protein